MHRLKKFMHTTTEGVTLHIPAINYGDTLPYKISGNPNTCKNAAFALLFWLVMI